MDKYSRLMWVVAGGILKNVGSHEDIEDCIAETFADLLELTGTKKDAIEEGFIQNEELGNIYRYSKTLKEPDGEIFRLRYFYELKPKEIACKLKLSVKEVSNRLYNSKKKLLEKMDAEEVSYEKKL